MEDAIEIVLDESEATAKAEADFNAAMSGKYRVASVFDMWQGIDPVEAVLPREVVVRVTGKTLLRRDDADGPFGYIVPMWRVDVVDADPATLTVLMGMSGHAHVMAKRYRFYNPRGLRKSAKASRLSQVARKYPQQVLDGNAMAREAGARVFFLFMLPGGIVAPGLRYDEFGPQEEPFFSFSLV